MIYAIATLSIENINKLNTYREHAAQALAKHGGKVVSTSATPLGIEGAPDLADAIAILSFPDKESSLNWINDADLAEVHALRRSAGRSEISLLG